MTTTKEVATKWETAIFNHDDILNITDKVLNYDVLFLEAQSENAKLYFESGINYAVYKVTRSPKKYLISGGRYYDFKVDVTYTLEKKPDINTEQKVSEFFEVLDDLVGSELGVTWGDVVTISNPQEQTLDLSATSINNLSCIRGMTTYTGQYYFVE